MRILAIETSCDETAAAVVEDGTKILSSVVASSTTMHEKYGGIVPEVAAREQLKCIIPVVSQALTDAFPSSHLTSHVSHITSSIDAIAVTVGPGLIGSLLIGVETAKTLAFVTQKPLIPVNHVTAHMYGNFLESSRHSREGGNPSTINSSQPWIPGQARDDTTKSIAFPAISLVVSGGHTELFLMESEKKLTWLGGTLDDAAGEAFDKTARLLGFGHGGGKVIQEVAQGHSHQSSAISFQLPRPLLHDDTLNFSFSGLKTAVMREWKKSSQLSAISSQLINAFAYEIQEAITDVLVKKTIKAAEMYEAKSILISGGVAANLRLREKFLSRITSHVSLFAPSPALCTDNAAYIASYAFFKGEPLDWHDITALPDLSVEENI